MRIFALLFVFFAFVRLYEMKNHSKRMKDDMVVTPDNISPSLICIRVFGASDVQTQMDGVLISLQWALTARISPLIFPEFTKNAMLGTSPITCPDDKSKMFAIESAYNYDIDKMFYDNIALVKLAKPLEQTPKVYPAPLPESFRSWSRCPIIDTFGRDPINSPMQVVTVHTGQCDEDEELDDTVLCLHCSECRLCRHDSGMPLICDTFLIGLVNSPDVCESESFATNIAHYMTWIGNVTGISVDFQYTPMHERMGDKFDYESKIEEGKDHTDFGFSLPRNTLNLDFSSRGQKLTQGHIFIMLLFTINHLL